MKKNVILSLIPACLLLASCNAPQEKAYDNELGNIIETTDAEDKEFLDAEIKYSDVSPISSIPSVGIQSVPDGEDKVKFRFIGAVTLIDKDHDGETEDDFEVGDVIWERRAYGADGSRFKNTIEIEASKVYERVSAANRVFDIEEFNKEHGTSYTHFVTYVVRGVNKSFGDGVLMANVRLKDNNKSKTLVTSANENTQFSFNFEAPRFCLVKKHADGLCETFASTPSYITPNILMRFEISLDDPNDSIMFLDHDSDDFTYTSYHYNQGDNELERVGNSYFYKLKTPSSGKYIVSFDASGELGVITANEFTAKLVVDDQSNSTWTDLKDYINQDNATRVLAKVTYMYESNEISFYYGIGGTATLYNYASKFLVPSGVNFEVSFVVYDGSASSFQTTNGNVTQPTGNTTLTCTLGTGNSVTWTQA